MQRTITPTLVRNRYATDHNPIRVSYLFRKQPLDLGEGIVIRQTMARTSATIPVGLMSDSEGIPVFSVISILCSLDTRISMRGSFDDEHCCTLLPRFRVDSESIHSRL